MLTGQTRFVIRQCDKIFAELRKSSNSTVIEFFSIAFILKKKRGPAESRAPDLRLEIRKVETCKKRCLVEKVLFHVKTLALAKVIVTDLVEQEFLPSKRDIRSFCPKT